MSKLLVFCIDALCASDVEAMRAMPHFGPFIARGAYVQKVEPVWPALTYCCHSSIITGCFVARHGVVHNEKIRRGGHFGEPWYSLKSEVKVPTLLDRARERGLTTCSLSWPVSGAAAYDMNMPMTIPYRYDGWEPERWLEETATRNLMDRYFHKHGRYVKGPDRNLDRFTMALALDILEDFAQPDVMLVKMCDLDTMRHLWGVYHPTVASQLRKHDEEFGAIVEVLRRKGTLDQTNIVILGDHGQTDVEDVFLLNVLLREAGFLTVDEGGKLTSYDAIAHSTGLGAYVELCDPSDVATRNRVRALLESLKDDPQVMLDYVLDAEETRQIYSVAGPFDFILESKRPISFGDQLTGDSIWGSKVPGDKRIGAATHGGSPGREEVTTFIAAGPNVCAGAVVDRCSLVDEAPTMARMLGFAMPDTDGKAIEELLG